MKTRGLSIAIAILGVMTFFGLPGYSSPKSSCPALVKSRNSSRADLLNKSNFSFQPNSWVDPQFEKLVSTSSRDVPIFDRNGNEVASQSYAFAATGFLFTLQNLAQLLVQGKLSGMREFEKRMGEPLTFRIDDEWSVDARPRNYSYQTARMEKILNKLSEGATKIRITSREYRFLRKLILAQFTVTEPPERTKSNGRRRGFFRRKPQVF